MGSTIHDTRVSAKPKPRAGKRGPRRSRRRPARQPLRPSNARIVRLPAVVAILAGLVVAYLVVQVHARYTLNFQTPVRLHFQWPFVVAHRNRTEDAAGAQGDQNGRPLTAYQQYTCEKFRPGMPRGFGDSTRREPAGPLQIYHYNTDGTLDWGYFQINTVHLKRPGLNLRDLLNCKANIDFAYQLYREKQDFTPWSTYNNGAYRRFLRN